MYRSSGEMRLFGYLEQRKDTILEYTYLNNFIVVPTTVEELSTFLPGRSHYMDVNELLTDIGKSRDADFLRSKVSKIFLISLALLKTMDESAFSNITRTLYADQLSNNMNSGEKINHSCVDGPHGVNIEEADVAYSDNACSCCLPVKFLFHSCIYSLVKLIIFMSVANEIYSRRLGGMQL